ncbi:MAG: hydrolase TatD [Alcanivorax sp.]|nr:hydrolase TatD [Alcanivorax sp.]MBI55749.1 hydrolase TatD [Alcanivorax sp.]MBM1143992.1 TatD family hydrolase [Alcanivorax sp. ZXX171]MBU57579.1 hydrolase TatD [Alcanivorax sp.]|tara:strand:+ start:10401 stop:11198 length:798 start_codon:yes stop_codon:yes gene_type:complete
MSDTAIDLVDSHCHLDRLNLDAYEGDFQAMMAATRADGISHMLCIGVDLETFPRVRELAERHDDVHATVGVHPLYKDSREPDADELVRLADHPRVVAIGETGLDYFYAKEERDWQRKRFVAHIQAARRTGLPLVIHTRGAKDDTLALLREHGGGEVRGVLHCFTEDTDMAEQAMAMGFYISISGIVTFRNAEALRDTVRALPVERLLIETDSPWLAPVPFRGKPNEPRHVARVAECVADLKGLPVAELARVTRDNFYTLFSKAAS